MTAPLTQSSETATAFSGETHILRIVRYSTLLSIALGLLVAAQGSAALRAESCAALAHLNLPDTTITHAALETSGSVLMPYDTTPLTHLPAFCRVQGILRPSADSDIHFEVWLPATKNWNGNFLGIGNGGFAGFIGMGGHQGYEELQSNLMRGYATAGSDSGHTGLPTDASWAYHHPEKVADFGWRALHLTTLRAKQIIHAYYGKPAHYAYFDSCSDGGREALMEAQRFPSDYDGILAGAPAAYWTSMLAGGLSETQAMMENPAAFIPMLKLPAIEHAALAACDAQDGVKDGIISDPQSCHFNPDVLLCKGQDSGSCLTAPQLATLKLMYKGGVNDAGKVVTPGFMPGDELAWGAWDIGADPGASYGAQYLNNFFRYMVTQNPRWNPLTADVDASLREAQQATGRELNATNPDLSKFASLGGKLILYHGWNDQAISPWNTIHYYHAVQHTLGGAKTASFVRLYMVPGMEHCGGGPGATDLGQMGAPTLPGAKYNAFNALVDWVQKGQAPGELIATKFAKGPDGKQKPVMTRPLCPYPKVLKYNGTGDTNKASSFSCVEP